VNRRTFLGALGATGLAGFAGVTHACGRAPGSAPAAGQSARRLEAIGLQLYTVRGELERDFEGTLRRVAAIGYRELEFAGYFGRSAAEVRDLLTGMGLTAPAGHLPLSDLEQEWDRTIEFAAGVGHRYVVVPWLPVERRSSLDSYRRLAALFNEFGERSRRAGLTFAYHNHEFEFADLEGSVPYDILLEETDPELVKMELDLYWIRNGGYDALDYFARHSGRFPLVHVKDSAGPPDERQADVGAGVIDWRAILGQRETAGIRHVFVEHDNPSDPFASVTAGFTYLQALEL
jgi:sugar phosphate isomerase/epimerase